MKLPGVPDGGYGHLGAGAGAGGHLGGGPSISSSPDGQDEAIDTLIVLLRLMGGFPGGGDGGYVLLAGVTVVRVTRPQNKDDILTPE